MPVLDVSELNVILGVLSTFILLYGIISVKIKAKWYLGEAREFLPTTSITYIQSLIMIKFLPSRSASCSVLLPLNS
jgi:hypothetical protein